MIALQKAGRSAGTREVIRLLSTTTGSSTDRAGTSHRDHPSRVETGRFLPSVRTLQRLARTLQATFEIGEDGNLAIRSGSLVAPTLAELRTRRDEILALATAEGAATLRVFGSVARGEAAPDSDIDLVVEFKPGYPLMNLSGLQIGLEEMLGRRCT